MSISRNFIIKAPKGGELHIVNADGEVITTVLVQPGRHRASYWFDMLEAGETLLPGNGVTASLGRSGVTFERRSDYAETDANPDFRPLGGTEKLVSQLQTQLAIMSASNKANAARARKAAQLERIPDAPAAVAAATKAADDASVVE